MATVTTVAFSLLGPVHLIYALQLNQAFTYKKYLIEAYVHFPIMSNEPNFQIQ